MAFRTDLRTPWIAIAVATCYASAHAYTPESPEVVAAIDRAVKYLEGAGIDDAGDEKFGGEALVATALLKADRGKDHPRVVKAIKMCRAYADQLNAKGAESMYSTALAAIFLIEVDARLYRKEIDKLMAVILRRQQPDGAWGYLGSMGPNNGDTSQTQYCVLALWEAHNHNIDVPPKQVAAVCNWLMRTQDPSGAFGYMGRDSGDVSRKINQSAVRHSMSVAGMGSLYVCMDLLGFQQEVAGDAEDGELPRDVRLVSVDEKNDPEKRRTPAVDLVNPNALRQSVQLGNAWFNREYRIEYGGDWQFYYMYGLERYQTFRDKVEGRTIKEPAWYNDGVNYLLKKQSRVGTWATDAQYVPAKTCFGVFFLTRSTQKTIGAILMNEGLLKGGRGFQQGELRSRGGKIVAAPLSRSVGDLLSTLDEGDEDELTAMAQSVATLKFEGDAATRTRQQAMLRGLVSHTSYKARIVAVKTLAKDRSLNNVPPLIFALSDPDWRVALEARNGLRFISRKINGFGLSEKPEKGEVSAAIEQWKAWYLSVRPDGQFFD